MTTTTEGNGIPVQWLRDFPVPIMAILSTTISTSTSKKFNSTVSSPVFSIQTTFKNISSSLNSTSTPLSPSLSRAARI